MQKAELISKTFLTEGVIELKLKTPKIATKAGQRLFIHFLDSEKSLKRAYSIAEKEDKENESIFTFLIKLIPGGKGSEQLRTASTNTKFGVEGPFGHFILKPTTNPKVFLSTGSGLAPCYAMAKADQSGAKKRFFFSVSYGKDLFYNEKIKNLKIPETHISISREKIEGFEHGRINIDRFNFPTETEFYICGVPQMVKEFLQKLKSRGYENIYIEAY